MRKTIYVHELLQKINTQNTDVLRTIAEMAGGHFYQVQAYTYRNDPICGNYRCVWQKWWVIAETPKKAINQVKRRIPEGIKIARDHILTVSELKFEALER